MLREVFSTKNGARPGAAHIAVVITDGVSSRPDQTMQQIELTHKSGVYVFTVGKVFALLCVLRLNKFLLKCISL